MTTAQLNRDIKRLGKSYDKFINDNTLSDDKTVKDEVTRLYYADREFQYMSKKSVLILLRVNLSVRAIPLHMFGLNVELKNLI